LVQTGQRPVEHRFVVGHAIARFVQLADRAEDRVPSLSRKCPVQARNPQPTVVPTSQKEPPEAKIEFRDYTSGRLRPSVTYGPGPGLGDVFAGFDEEKPIRLRS
jgi:hypothetical protein